MFWDVHKVTSPFSLKSSLENSALAFWRSLFRKFGVRSEWFVFCRCVCFFVFCVKHGLLGVFLHVKGKITFNLFKLKCTFVNQMSLKKNPKQNRVISVYICRKKATWTYCVKDMPSAVLTEFERPKVYFYPGILTLTPKGGFSSYFCWWVLHIHMPPPVFATVPRA